MSTAPNCNFIGATLCPGSTGPSPLWVNKATLPGNFLGTGGSFAYDGACYSVPANAQPQPPSGGGYANAGYMGETSAGCVNCCAVKPATVYFDCSGTGTATINVSGPPNSIVYLSWSSCYLVVNGVGPNNSGGSTTITLGSSGGTFTVGTSSSVCAIPCPGGPADISVGTTQGGEECGTVDVYTGCKTPATPIKGLGVTLTQPIVGFPPPPNTSGCSSTFSNACQGTGSLTMTGTLGFQATPDGNPSWSGSISGDASYGPNSSGCYSVSMSQSVFVTCNEVPTACNPAGLVWTITVGSPEAGAWYCSKWSGGTETCGEGGAWGTMVSHSENTDADGYPDIVSETVPPYQSTAIPACLPDDNLTCGTVPSATITIKVAT